MKAVRYMWSVNTKIQLRCTNVHGIRAVEIFLSLSCSSCFIPVSEVKLSDILRYFFLPVSSHIHIWSCLWGRKCDSFGEGRRKFCDLPYSFCFLKQIPNSTSNHQIFQVSFINFKFYPIIFNFICIEIDQWKNILNGRK